jgi:hypothetical protein
VASGSSAAKRKKVRVLFEHRRLPGVDAVGVDDHPGLGGLPEDLRQPYPGNGLGGQHVAEHLAGTHRRQLVDVADQQQVRTGGHGLDQFVRQNQVEHARLVDHDQVGVDRVVAVEGRLSAGA